MKRTRKGETAPTPREDGALEMGGLVVHPGQRIGAYIFLREIGSGGMARVLLAKDPNGELMALKVLRQSRFKTGLARFRREFRALSRVNHPNVIRVDAYGDLHGHPYIAMEYVDGPDLHSLIRSFRGWDPDKRYKRCEEILVDLCSALSAIHRRGLVHRDLKPSNVLITREGVCKLTDFGIVKDLDPSHDAQLSTTLVGTWAYASPEQISGNPIDHRSDLYSLGVILFAMLTGKRPFVANDMAGYLALHRDRPAPAPRDVSRSVPAHLDEICRRLLQKAPRDRFQSAQEILYRLEAEERVPEPSEMDAWQPPLVGRQLETDALQDAVAALTRREGGVIVLEGDDGSGKSRLLDVVADRTHMLGIPYHRIEFSSDKPVFAASMKLARALIEELGPKAPKAVQDDINAYSEAAPPRGDARYALYDALRDLLHLAIDEVPRVILFDDLHEANARELDLLAFLVRTLIQQQQQPLLVIGSLRPKGSAAADAFVAGDGMDAPPRELTVGPLQREDVMDILFGMLGDSLGARLLAQRIHTDTEGNCYFVTELVRSLVARKVIREVSGGYELTLTPDEVQTGHLEIPPGVRQMMKSRLDGVLAGDRSILEVLAVGGRDMDLDLLLDVLERDEEDVLNGLDHLLKSGIVRERRSGDSSLYTVTHRKFADVVYRDLAPSRRADLHRRMAAAMELHFAQNPAALEIVGEHYRRAGDAGRAYRYLVAAAKRLSDRSLMQEAWDLAEKAGTLEDSAMTDLLPEEFRSFRLDNLTVRAAVHYNRAEWADADRAYRAALLLAEEANDPRAACECRLKLATVLRRRGNHTESRTFAEQALEASRRLHYREGVADALHCMAALCWAEGNLDDCERMANEGLLIAQGSQLADRRAELLLALTAAQATRGALASATMGLTEAEGIFRELRMKRPRCLALANIAELLTWQGEPLQARQRAHVAVQLATELDYKLGKTAATRAMAVAALDLGLYDEAGAGLLSALALASEIDLAEEVLACHVGLTQLALERGERDQARAHAVAGLEAASQRDPERYASLLRALLASALSEIAPADAREHAATATAQVDSLPVPRRTQVQLALTWAHYRIGDAEEARAMGRRVLQSAGSRGFRLLNLEARALMTQLSEGPDRDTHRVVGQELAKDFSTQLGPELALAFMKRPFLKFLDDPAVEAAPATSAQD